MTKKKRWPVWKIVVVIFAAIFGVMVVINLISVVVTGEYIFKSDKEPTSEEQGVDLNNLTIGQTATWNGYSITVDDVSLDGNNIVATVTMNAKYNSQFAGRYLKGITESNLEIDPQKVNDITVGAGESYQTRLIYPATDITALEWDNWANEAIWHFAPLAQEVEAREAPQEPKAEPEEADSDAWGAVEQYGSAAYPYGFKLHLITGQIANYRIAQNTYVLKVLCDITNAYGATAKNQTCEATVEKVGDSWKVKDFLVY